MSPQWTSTLGIVFVVMAGVQVWLMLEVVGREKSKFNERFLSIMHRVNGYLFSCAVRHFSLCYDPKSRRNQLSS